MPRTVNGTGQTARAQVFSDTSEITVSTPGKAEISVRDPRPSRPPAPKRRNKTQAIGVSVTFKCYGADVTVLPGTFAPCGV